MSDDYRRAKSLRRQFERTWRWAKNSLNRSRLRRQIVRCNVLVNKDKSDYCSKLISDNSHDSRKLWRELHKTLNKVSNATLPSHDSKNHWLTSLPPSFPTKLRKLEITLVPVALKMIFTLLQILQKLTSLGKFLRRLLTK